MQRKTLIWIGFVCGLVAGVVISLALWRGGSNSTSASTGNLVVLCPHCLIDEQRRVIGTILLDTSTGDIWVYSDEALAGSAKPIRWGKFTLGQPVTRFTPNQ